jgi:hypothetical protein
VRNAIRIVASLKEYFGAMLVAKTGELKSPLVDAPYSWPPPPPM